VIKTTARTTASRGSLA